MKKTIYTITTIAIILTISIVGFYLINRSNKRTQNQQKSIAKAGILNNIIFNHKANTLYIVSGDSEFKVETKFTRSKDDIFINQEGKYLIIQNFKDLVIPDSYIYEITQSELKLVQEIYQRKVIYYSPDSYIFSDESTTYLQKKELKIRLTDGVSLLATKAQRDYESYLIQSKRNGVLNEFTVKSNYASGYSFTCFYCPGNKLATRFIFTDQYQIYFGVNTDDDKGYIDIYERENKDISSDQQEKRNQTKLIKSIPLEKAPVQVSKNQDFITLNFLNGQESYSKQILNLKDLTLDEYTGKYSNEYEILF